MSQLQPFVDCLASRVAPFVMILIALFAATFKLGLIALAYVGGVWSPGPRVYDRQRMLAFVFADRIRKLDLRAKWLRAASVMALGVTVAFSVLAGFVAVPQTDNWFVSYQARFAAASALGAFLPGLGLVLAAAFWEAWRARRFLDDL